MWYRNQQTHRNVWECIIYTVVCLLHVSATHMANLRVVHCPSTPAPSHFVPMVTHPSNVPTTYWRTIFCAAVEVCIIEDEVICRCGHSDWTFQAIEWVEITEGNEWYLWKRRVVGAFIKLFSDTNRSLKCRHIAVTCSKRGRFVCVLVSERPGRSTTHWQKVYPIVRMSDAEKYSLSHQFCLPFHTKSGPKW